MKNIENLLASSMLSDYSSRLGDDCCSDWEFPDTWTYEDRFVFTKEYHDWNGDPEEFNKDNLRLSNFCVAAFLSAKLEQIVTTKLR